MEWEQVSNDEIDIAVGHFSGMAYAALAVVSDLIMEVDRRRSWLADGSANLVDWVAARLAVRRGSASTLVGLSRRLIDLPLLKACFAAGEFSLDQLDSLSKIATADTEAGLIGEARGWSNSMLDREARRGNPPVVETVNDSRSDRYLFIQRSLDGLAGTLRAGLAASELDVVESAVRERAEKLPVNPETGVFDPWYQRMADGLVEVCSETTGGDVRPALVTVHTDLSFLVETGASTSGSGFAESDLGSLFANETARRLSCDSIVECAVYQKNHPLGVGRRSRTVPKWLRRQLQYRDGGCRFPGCGRTLFVHAHHIRHWADGGPTDLGNLVLLCGFHHRFLHEHRWSITTTATGTGFVFSKPDGRVYPPEHPRLHPRLRALVEQPT